MIHDTCTLILQCLVSRQVGVGRQRGTKVQESGDSDPPVPPSPFAKAGMAARANLNFWLDGDRNKYSTGSWFILETLNCFELFSAALTVTK